MSAATGTLLTIGAIAASSAGSAYAAHKQTSAANKAAEIGGQSSREALDYQKAEAARDAQRYETDRRANYDLAASREGRLGTLNQMFGFGARQGMPAYVPGEQATPGGPAGANDGAAQFIAQWQQSHKPSEGPAPLLAALQAKGFNVAPYMYGSTPSNNEIALNGEKYKVIGGEDNPATASWYVPGTNDSPRGALGSLSSMFNAPVVRPALQTPTGPYVAPSTLRDLARRR